MENTKPCFDADAIVMQIERFSGLSSEMISLLEDLRREMSRAALELQDVQAAVNAGRQELEALREIEKETSALGQQIEDLRRQKASMEIVIADQRNAWVEENARRAMEEREQEESLKSRRRREEAEARQKLEEELDLLRQKADEVRVAEEREFRDRKAALDTKERELALLMQELEKFLSGLAGRIVAAAPREPNAPGVAESGLEIGTPAFFGMQEEFKGGFNPGNALMWEDAGEV